MPITLTRTITVIMIPGGVAIASWILFLLLHIEASDADSFYKNYTYPINIIFVAIAIILGSVIEGLNTHLEVKWDNEQDSKFDVTKNWYAYLCRTLPSEPIAYRYISKMGTTMYFELGMMWAIASFSLGLSAVICYQKPECFQLCALLSLVAGVGGFFYFKWQAKTSHEVLCKTRYELNERRS